MSKCGNVRSDPVSRVTPFREQVLGFVGLTDVEFIYVEGLARSGDQKEQALKAAEERISELTSAS